MVRRVASYVRWLRQVTGRDLQYAATYELTARGRLHVNLLLSPWKYVPQSELQAKWGSRVWIEQVDGAEAIGVEVAKAPGASEGKRSQLGRYLSKLEQSVKDGRRVSYSRSWPREPDVVAERVGEVAWERITVEGRERFEIEKKLGEWHPVRRGEFARPSWHPEHKACKCFDFVNPSSSRGPPHSHGPPEATHGPDA